MQQPPTPFLQADELDNIPFEGQRVIDELVELWQTHEEPPDLLLHIRDTMKIGNSVTYFFAQVRNEYSKYPASSVSEFRQFLEAEFRQLYRPYAERQAKAEAERQAQAKAEAERQEQIRIEIERQAQEFEERRRRARAEFDTLKEMMAKTTDRKERIGLGRKLKAVAPNTGVSYVSEKHCKNCFRDISLVINPQCLVCTGYICLYCECCFCESEDYNNECWNCHLEISKETSDFCLFCGWYICSNCDSCKKPVCDRTYTHTYVEAGEPFLPDFPDDLS